MKTFLIAAFVLFSASAFGQMTTGDFCDGKYKKYYIHNPQVRDYEPYTGYRFSNRNLYIDINNGTVEARFVGYNNTYCIGQMTKTVRDSEEVYTFDNGSTTLLMIYKDGILYCVVYITDGVTVYTTQIYP